MGLFDNKPLTEDEVAARQVCKSGCLLSDHDPKGFCMRDCGRCPDSVPCEVSA